MSRRLIVTTMRNEAPFIFEWLVYHRLIGFTDFLIYSNDCDDGTDQILNRLEKMGMVTHLDNPRSGKKTVQWQALSRAWETDIVQGADWIMVSDVDEFLTIRAGEGALEDLFAARPNAEGFVLSWRMFGNNKRYRRGPGLVIENFTHAAPEALIWPWRAVQFKTLFRLTPEIKKLGVHRPRMKNDAAFKSYVDDNGNPLPRMGGTLFLHTGPRYQLAQLNHYALGSIEDFLIRVDRGKPNHTSENTGLDYWMDRNFNAVEDTEILRHADAINQGVADLMNDPMLSELYEKGLAWRKKRYDELMLTSDGFYLQARVQQVGSTLVLPMRQQTQLLNQLFQMRLHQSR